MELAEPNAQPYETTQTPEASDLNADIESKLSFGQKPSHPCASAEDQLGIGENCPGPGRTWL
jgi:hypothetical protein